MTSSGQPGPTTPTARRARVVELLARSAVRSQGELADLLADEGIVVPQATLSRDLVELGAVKVSRLLFCEFLRL